MPLFCVCLSNQELCFPLASVVAIFIWLCFCFYSLRSTRGLVHVVMVGYIVDNFCLTFLILDQMKCLFLNIYIYHNINFLQLKSIIYICQILWRVPSDLWLADKTRWKISFLLKLCIYINMYLAAVMLNVLGTYTCRSSDKPREPLD